VRPFVNKKVPDTFFSPEIAATESNGKPGKAGRKPTAKSEPQANGSFGVGEIRKAAQFANSIGGLDKAIALLQS
jgi:hypothetical protein